MKRITDIEPTNGASRYYRKAMSLYGDCNHPNHPGCPVCQPDTDFMCYRLTPAAQELYEEWLLMTNERGCMCHQCPPCSVCTHEGHPVALLEDKDSWDLSSNTSLTSYDWLENNS